MMHDGGSCRWTLILALLCGQSRLAAFWGRHGLYAGGKLLKHISSGFIDPAGYMGFALLLRRFIFFLDVAELGRELEMESCFIFIFPPHSRVLQSIIYEYVYDTIAVYQKCCYMFQNLFH